MIHASRLFAGAAIASLAFAIPLLGSAIAAFAEQSTSDVYSFTDDSAVSGAASNLVRTDKIMSMTLKTHTLEPGAYTNW